MNKPLVSVCCITYNHQDYIEDCINGFLKQELNYDIEFLIHDDASTDKTQSIIKSLVGDDPRFKLILRNKNIKSTGKAIFPILFEKAQGKYIALCEGDDYWTDPLKLQKQVDFLENNSEYVISCHNSNIVDGDGNFKKLFNKFKIPETTETKYLITEPWYIPTASVVFRKNHLSFPEWYFKVKNGDYALYLLLTYKKNLIHYDNVVMSAYRIHGKGVSNMFKRKNVYSHSMIFIHQNFNDFSKKKYDENCLKNISYHSYKILKNTSVYSKEFWSTLTNLILYKRRVDKKLLHLLKRRLLKKIKFNYFK